VRELRPLLLVIVFIALLALSCGDGGDEGTEGPLPPANEVLAKAIEAVDGMETFHFRLEHENGASRIPLDLQLVTAEGDVVVPDRLRAKLEAMAGRQTVRVEVIGIGDDGWITNPFNRQWQPLPSGTTIKDVFDPAQGVKVVATSLQDPQVTAEEEVDGVPSYVLEGTVESAVLEAAAPIAEPGFTIRVKVWLGKEDSLMRRIYLEGPIAADEPQNIVRKLFLSGFNKPVTITPPPA
jgi:lipoprotein LprG